MAGEHSDRVQKMNNSTKTRRKHRREKRKLAKLFEKMSFSTLDPDQDASSGQDVAAATAAFSSLSVLGDKDRRRVERAIRHRAARKEAKYNRQCLKRMARAARGVQAALVQVSDAINMTDENAAITAGNDGQQESKGNSEAKSILQWPRTRK